MVSSEDLTPVATLCRVWGHLCLIVAALVTSSLQLAYFPRAFRHAICTTIPKPGKSVEAQRYAKGWRPISLIVCVSKGLECYVAQHLSWVCTTDPTTPLHRHPA